MRMTNLFSYTEMTISAASKLTFTKSNHFHAHLREVPYLGTCDVRRTSAETIIVSRKEFSFDLCQHTKGGFIPLFINSKQKEKISSSFWALFDEFLEFHNLLLQTLI
jgi:hypothetical protein